MIAIKDMETPKACYRCPLLDGEYGTCNIIGETKIDMTEERAKNCPLVEMEERKHGEWEHDKLFGDCAYVCSFCHTIWTSSEIQNMHYCPTCGADMRGAENE